MSEEVTLGETTMPQATMPQATMPLEEEPVIELGDRIRLLGGKHDKTSGRVIYRTEDELHLMPDGLTNTALIFPLTEEGFDPEAAIESVEILSKRRKPALIDILDLNVDQILETFDATGKPLSTYTIIKVIPEEDTIVVKNEEEGEVFLNFNYRGIPNDLPFRVIRSRQAPEEPKAEPLEDETTKEEEEGEVLEDYAFLDEELEAPAESMEYFVEIPRAERIYSVIEQKSEAYAELLSLNTLPMQKLLTTQKSVRVLTELFFHLRSSILRVANDGTPDGLEKASLQDLINILETGHLTLSRAVIDADKILYHDLESEKANQNTEGVNFQYFDHKIASSVNYLLNSNDVAGQKFRSFFNGYLEKYGSSWIPNVEPRVAFQTDEEVFRAMPPDKNPLVPGYPSDLPTKKRDLSSEYATKLSMSLMRCLKAVRSRGHLLQPGEEAAILSYILFPLEHFNSLTTVRLESLTKDILAGLTSMKSMKEIIDLGEITDIPSSKHPFVVGVQGGTLGNIPIRDYLNTVGLKAEGMGDVWHLQTVLGMKENEWTLDQQVVLSKIITATQNQILSEILRQREVLEQAVLQPPAVQGIQMIPDGPAMIQKLAEEPYLREIQTTIKEQMPAFANSDVALVGLLLRNHSEMAFAMLADQPAALTRERMRYARNEYLNALQIYQKRKQRALDAGQPPIEIHCAHVKPLQMIRKVKDINTRFALLSKFLTTFQGIKEDNWVKCNASAGGSSHNLLCVHELLQIYQYLRPGDVAVLNKDIQLTYGGGQFQGHYICRNCGQPISELEFDTHLEFDDNGVPMMGRSELVDKDAITLEEIDQILGPAGDLKTEMPSEFNNEDKKLYYMAAKQLADRLNAPLEKADYLRIVNRTYAFIQTLPVREVFVKQIQKVLQIDYDIYKNRAVLCAIGAHMLIVIQTKMPDMFIRASSGCRSLGGQPLKEDNDTTGIDCIVSTIASIQINHPPWNLTQFKDQKVVQDTFLPILKNIIMDPTILNALAEKRNWQREVLGEAAGQGRPSEILPSNFAPIPYEMKAEDFVEKVIVPEAATVEDRAELWIRQGNALAKKNKMSMPIAFSETSCCISPLSTLDTFWKSSAVRDSLPTFSKREGIQSPPKITRTEPTMKPSQIVRPLPDAPEESYYLLFLKVCYDGERKGYTHEFGLTHTCMWCGLKVTDETKGLQAIESQGIEVTKETFEDLLNETHRVNSFKTRMHLEITGPLENWISLVNIDPEPAVGYKDIMTKTQNALEKLPPDAKEDEVARALSDFSILADTMKIACEKRLSSKQQHALLESLVSNGAESIMRFLQSYVMVPLQQLISKTTPQLSIQKAWKLSDQHEKDITRLLLEHRSYISKFNKVVITPWLKAKIQTLLLQTRSILDVLVRLRPLQVPGSRMTYKFLLEFCLYAPLANFVDPDTLPIAASISESQIEQDVLFPATFISTMINRFKEEGFNLTPEQVRELIAKRNEQEKANILSNMSKMDRAGKEIEMIKMRLGIGDWAVGGTKAIYAYDPERYDIERDQRAEAGIIDFPGYGPEGPSETQLATPDGRPIARDAFGFDLHGAQEEGYIGDSDLADAMGFDED